MLSDLRLALRSLLRTRALTFAALASLVVGFGGSAAMFSAVNGVVLQPLPFPRPQELVAIRDSFPPMNLPDINVSVAELQDYRTRTQSFVDVGAFADGDANLAGEAGAERVRVTYATAALFHVLGVHAQLGRTFLPEEDDEGRSDVAVLSNAFWRRRFGADPSVIGRTVVLDGKPTTVVGVLPPGVAVREEPQLWAPFGFTPEQLTPARRGFRFLSPVARLKPGVSIQQARADLATLADALRAQYPDGYPPANGWTVFIAPLEESLLGQTRGRLFMLLGAVALLLLGACANVANLLLARAAERSREMAVRTALGASRPQLARQLLTEALLLGLCGAALGLVFASFGIDALVALAPEGLPRLSQVRVDGTTAAVTLALCLVTSLGFGLAPLWAASRVKPHDALKAAGRTTARSNAAARAALVVAQVALAGVLLSGAALMLRSFAAISAVEAGFSSEGVLVAKLGLSPGTYPTPEKGRDFFLVLLDRVRSLPGVEAAGVTSIVPLDNRSDYGFRREGREALPVGVPSPNAEIRYVSAGYLETLRVPLLSGRHLSAADGPDAPKVVVISRALAAKYFPGEDAVGQRLRLGGAKSMEPWETVVGVVDDVRERGLEEAAPPVLYEPFAQRPRLSASLVLRTRGGFEALTSALRTEVAGLDASQPVYDVEPLAAIVRRSTADRLFSTVLMGLFGVAALLLAGVGLFGLLQHAVTSRTQEIGVRLALGATNGGITRWVLSRALRLTALGLAFGVAGALALSFAVRGFVFGVPAQDPASLLGAAGALLLLALLASAVPTWRAVRVDPAESLKAD